MIKSSYPDKMRLETGSTAPRKPVNRLTAGPINRRAGGLDWTGLQLNQTPLQKARLYGQDIIDSHE